MSLLNSPIIEDHKIFIFYWDKYKVDFTIETEGIPSYYIALGTNFGIDPQ